MHVERQIFDIIRKSKKSVLLIGPRQTGKSTLLKKMEPEITLNLADDEEYFQHLRNPGRLKEVTAGKKKVFIDEIQRIPSLLNIIQVLLDEDKSRQFLLTGSSARKLRHGKANLLPGRILYYELGPLTFMELPGNLFSLTKALSRGMLPGIYLESTDEWKKLLKSYVTLYLKEEVQAEALTRDIQGFSRFFDITLSRSGQYIDFTKYASHAMVERTTARRYFDILIDTLILDQLEPFASSKRRRLIQHPKYYCFDVGVLNSILGGWEVSEDRKGLLFEHFIFQQMRSLQKGLDQDIRFSTYRTENDAEVDFIVEKGSEIFAIEVKASKNVGRNDLRGLKSFSEFYKKSHRSMVLSLNDKNVEVDGIEILPWQEGLKEIFES